MKILICGCERSGTTVIAKLLAQSSGLKLLNDPEQSWYIYPLVRVMGLRGMPLNFIYKLWKYDLVKVPGFVTILPQLKKLSINSFKVIYMVRDPRDNYAAIKERLNEDLNGLYLNIGFLGLKGKSQVENIALRWNAYLDSAIEYNRKNNNVYFLKYEDFLKDKVGKVEELSKFCNIKFDSSKFVHDVDVQINKSWSKEIKGENRYLKELTEEEINVITEVTRMNMNYFNYY